MSKNEKKLEKKNLIIIGIFIISIIIILFGGALIYNKFFYKKSFSEVETIMEKAAKEYYGKNKDKLPKTIGSSITITEDTLVKNDKMNTIDSYVKQKGTSCDGEVTITNINGDYRYAATIDCGKNYQTKTLLDYVKEKNDIVTTGDGLYKINNDLVYRGEYVNNYLKINNRVYRIVKFKDNNPVVIYTDESESYTWDNRYNVEKNSNVGINDYEVSRLRNHLSNIYKSNTALLSENDKLMVVQHNLPLGKRCNDDKDKTGTLENAKVLTEQYIGLLTVSDYLNASTDKNCTTTISPSCANYNYLGKFRNIWWTITANSKNTYKAYQVVNGAVSTANASATAHLRPVLYLAEDVIVVSGNGSKNNPFIIK